MAAAEIVRLAPDAPLEKVITAVNALADVTLGNVGARQQFKGYDGIEMDPVLGTQIGTGRYSMVVQNSGANHVQVRNAADNADVLTVTDTGVSSNALGSFNAGISATTGTFSGSITTAASLFVGDTANANMTLGLTVNQGAADDEAIALKSSDVAHGVTTLAETDTYALLKKLTPTGGGLLVRGLNAGSAIGFQVIATGSTEDTTKATTSLAAAYISANKVSGAAAAALAANGNLFVVASAGAARFIVDVEGDIHADAASGTANTGTGYLVYDEYEDAELIRALDVERAGPGLVRTEFDRLLRYGRADLEAAGIARFNDHEGGDGSIFVNYSALTRLLSGAVWQMHTRMRQLETEITETRRMLTP